MCPCVHTDVRPSVRPAVSSSITFNNEYLLTNFFKFDMNSGLSNILLLLMSKLRSYGKEIS